MLITPTVTQLRNDSSHLAASDHIERMYASEGLVRAIVPAIFSLIAVLGLTGNLLVIIVIASSTQMRSSTNVLILNLALADLVFIIICVPLTAVGYSLTTWPFGDVMCKLYQYVIYVTAYASAYNLVLMSLDRYLAVVHPISSLTLRTPCYATILASILWLLILLLNFSVVLDHGTIEYLFLRGEKRSACLNLLIFSAVEEYSVCGWNETSSNAPCMAGRETTTMATINYQGRLFYAKFFTFGYIVPLSLICVLYGLMLRRLLYGTVPGDQITNRRNQSSSSATSSQTSSNRQKRKAKLRVTRLVVTVVVIFALCWLPIQLLLVLQFFGNVPEDDLLWVALKIAFSCLAYANSCVNPYLYAFLSDNFRKTFRQLLCCRSVEFESVERTGRAATSCCNSKKRYSERRECRNAKDSTYTRHGLSGQLTRTSHQAVTQTTVELSRTNMCAVSNDGSTSCLRSATSDQAVNSLATNRCYLSSSMIVSLLSPQTQQRNNGDRKREEMKRETLLQLGDIQLQHRTAATLSNSP